jgi:hypothetical protein
VARRHRRSAAATEAVPRGVRSDQSSHSELLSTRIGLRSTNPGSGAAHAFATEHTATGLVLRGPGARLPGQACASAHPC